MAGLCGREDKSKEEVCCRGDELDVKKGTVGTNDKWIIIGGVKTERRRGR